MRHRLQRVSRLAIDEDEARIGKDGSEERDPQGVARGGIDQAPGVLARTRGTRDKTRELPAQPPAPRGRRVGGRETVARLPRIRRGRGVLDVDRPLTREAEGADTGREGERVGDEVRARLRRGDDEDRAIEPELSSAGATA